MKRFDPIPLVQMGGVQPFHGSTPQPPGAALLAMMRGATFSGANPVDAQRGLQAASSQPTLLTALASSYVQPPGTSGPSWKVTPDQRDRNTAWSIEQMMAAAIARERRAAQHTPTQLIPAWRSGSDSQRSHWT